MKTSNLKSFSAKLLSLMFAMAIVMSTVVLSGCSGEKTTSSSSSQVKATVAQVEETTVASVYETPDVPDNAIYATIDVEDYGTVTVALYPDYAPITVDNFVSLAKDGFYDGLTFHRIMEGFMAQGGDPLGNGTGGSSEEIKGEFTSNGVNNTLSHTRGAISMARSNDPDSASSQFFIVHEDSTFLDGQYAVFGYVTEGMDVIDKICEDANPTDDNGTIKSSEQPVIKSIKIAE
ncbi:MAG: peptidylprolyl isomerase [Ruminococcus sp.]|nr:peptidylprolyl isomerase [Ruminococcus sp.]